MLLHEAWTAGEITVQRPGESRRWTFAPDIGRALIALLRVESLRHSLYQVESGECVTNLALARQIARLCDVPLRLNEDVAAAGEYATEMDDAPPGRLQDDTGFSDWTPLGGESLRATLESLRLGTRRA